MTSKIDIVQPEGWVRPRGYSNGVVGEGRVLFIAGQLLSGDFGVSLQTRVPVVEEFMRRFPATLELTIFAAATYPPAAATMRPLSLNDSLLR